MKFSHKILIGFLAIITAALASFTAHAYPDSWQLQASLQKSDNIKLADQVRINFSLPMISSEVEKNISISPEIPVEFRWENKNKQLVITPANHWQSETRYTVSINSGKSILFNSIDSKVSFFTEKKPLIESILPVSGEKNVAVDIEQPVTVRFSRSLNEYSIKFIVTPDQKLSYEMSDDKKTIKLLANDDFKFSTEYKIQVFLKYKTDDQAAFQKAGETVFTTIAAPAPPPSQWPANLNDRAALALKSTQPQIITGKYIDVSLKHQVMIIFENGQALDAYIISSGKKGLETPTGSFQTYNKSTKAWSKKYSLWMPNWMAIVPSGEIGIHELPEWPGGYKEGANHLGTPVSHGCVRLGVGAAKRVFDWADLGTPVIIHN